MRRWSFLAVLIGLSLLTLWAGCSNPNLAGGKLHFDQARLLEEPERSARYRRALQTFQKACEEMPASGEARLWLGETYAELDRPDSADMNFVMAEKLAPTTKELVATTRDHYYSDKYNSALASAGAALKARGQGDEKGAMTGFRDALSRFRKAATYSPNHPQTYTMMGKVYLNLAKVDSALVLLQKAREIAPNDEKVKNDLYSVYREEGDKAFQSASEAIGSAKSHQDSLTAGERFQSAAELYRAADSIISGESDLSFQLGATAYELAQIKPPSQRAELYNESITRYEAVLKDNPADADVLYNLVLVLRDVKRNQEARDYALRLVDLKPHDGVYREILGRTEDALDSVNGKQALLSSLVFGRALKSGLKVDAGEAAKRADAFGSGTEIKRRYLENGAPEEILTFNDAQGAEYEVWFYWSRGLGYGFVGGKEKFSTKFVPDAALQLGKAEIGTKAGAAALTGTISNKSGHKFTYARAEFKVFDDEGGEIGRVHASTSELNAHGTWTYEIPLTGAKEKAVKAELISVLGY
jgi:tetratricopeptide (TPR) repeat protein